MLYIYRDTRYIAIVKTEQANLKASPTASHSGSVRSSHPEQTVGAGDFGVHNMTYPQLNARRDALEAANRAWHWLCACATKSNAQWLKAKADYEAARKTADKLEAR